jgi:hypothetical protein
LGNLRFAIFDFRLKTQKSDNRKSAIKNQKFFRDPVHCPVRPSRRSEPRNTDKRGRPCRLMRREDPLKKTTDDGQQTAV